MQGTDSPKWITTERIMLGIRTHLPTIPTSTYNRIFEHTLNELGAVDAQLAAVTTERDALRDALKRSEKDHRNNVATLTRQLLQFEGLWDALKVLSNSKNYLDPTFDPSDIAAAAITAAKGGAR